MKAQSCTLTLLLAVFFAVFACFADAEIHYHVFNIETKPVKRLCKTVNVATINGQFPGPTLEVRDGDTLVIKAINNAKDNISLHWHGLRQLRNPWADGPSYITQCPIRPGKTYTYRIKIQNQEGTLWWHSHFQWLRATVYGALIIYPKLGKPYPFLMPRKEIPILLGEWWNRNPQSVLRQSIFTRAGPNVSNAYTINSQPGDLYPCSKKETAIFTVEAGETVLLRVINAALNQELFFGVANHKLTVVAADASYTKPFSTSVIMIGPGQTTDVLLTADQPPARYYMAAHVYNSANVPFDNTTTTAILQYKNFPTKKGTKSTPIFAQLPGFNDTATATAFTAQFRSPRQVPVPTAIDVSLFFTTGLGLINCSNPNSPRCQGPNGTRFAASINNVSFVLPTRNSILQAYYQGQRGVFTTDFPPVPPVQFDYTGNVPRGLYQPVKRTKVYKIRFGSHIQIVLQNTNIVSVENHPMHLHGYSFYVVGTGFGNFNPRTDPAKFNLVNPPHRNTIGTPPGGWIAIRFVADNPGVWFLHCHLDSHLSWGLAVPLLVENGVGVLEHSQPGKQNPPPRHPTHHQNPPQKSTIHLKIFIKRGEFPMQSFKNPPQNSTIHSKTPLFTSKLHNLSQNFYKNYFYFYKNYFIIFILL